jgi:hypothetical protein
LGIIRPLVYMTAGFIMGNMYGSCNNEHATASIKTGASYGIEQKLSSEEMQKYSANTGQRAADIAADKTNTAENRNYKTFENYLAQKNAKR